MLTMKPSNFFAIFLMNLICCTLASSVLEKRRASSCYISIRSDPDLRDKNLVLFVRNVAEARKFAHGFTVGKALIDYTEGEWHRGSDVFQWAFVHTDMPDDDPYGYVRFYVNIWVRLRSPPGHIGYPW